MSLASLKKRLKRLESKVLKKDPRAVVEWHIKKRMIILKGGDLSELGKRPGSGRRESLDDRVIEERIKRRKAKLESP